MKTACFTVAAMDWFEAVQNNFAGGNALNQSVHFASLGHQTAFIGALGTDEAGRLIKDLLVRRKVITSQLVCLPGITARNRLYNDEAGERFGEEGAWENGVYGEFRLRDSDWDFLYTCQLWSTHANCPDFAATLKAKTDRQILAVDYLHLTDLDFVQDSLKAVDIACFGGTPDMEEGLANLSTRNPGAVIVLTLGKEGSLAFRKGKSWRQPALPVSKVVDTTGCGDSFQAHFVDTWIKSGDMEKSLLAGARAGQKTCTHHGALTWD